MSLDASKWIDELGYAPKNNSKQDILEMLDLIRKKNKVSECFLAIGFSVSEILNERNISDDLFDAYKLSMPIDSEKVTLYEKYLHHLENGKVNDEGVNESVEGLIGAIKGKLAEIRLIQNEDILKERFPKVSEFKMHPDPTHPNVDVYGYDEDGNVLVKIQSKMGDVDYESTILEELAEDNERYFSIADESIESIENDYPEYADRILNGLNLSNIDLNNEVTDSLETLKGNFGLDVPDTFAKALSSTPEIILGYKILKEVFDSNNEHAQLEKDLKTKLTVLRVAVLLNKFGFIKLGASIGAVSGSGMGLLGTIAGGVGGAFIGNKTASLIEPQLLDLVLKIMELSKDDLFYYKNKNSIDDFALSFSESNKLFN